MTPANNIWEEKYAAGHTQKYPWDAVVSFVFRFKPKAMREGNLAVLEVGCGTGSNLSFAAKEGFSVYGIDASISAIKSAKANFKKNSLIGNFIVGDFTQLPFDSNKFDLVIDRAGITCTGKKNAKKAIHEVFRVLKKNGKFFFNSYSTNHASNIKTKMRQDGSSHMISEGTLAGLSGISFYSKSELDEIFQNWLIHKFEHVIVTDELSADKNLHAEWRVVAEKDQ